MTSGRMQAGFRVVAPLLVSLSVASCSETGSLWQEEPDVVLPAAPDVEQDVRDVDFGEDDASGCSLFGEDCPEENARCLPGVGSENRCVPAGPLEAGDRCVVGEVPACGAGTLCAGPAGLQSCRPLCSPVTAPCPEEERCQLAAPGLGWGLCAPGVGAGNQP